MTKKKYSYKELDRLPPEKVDRMLSEGLIERPFYMGYLEHRKKKAFSTMRQRDIDDGVEHKYPTFKFGMSAYTYALENNVSHKEALEFAAHYVGEDLVWLDEVKNKRFTHSKKVYEEHKEHPVQKDMVQKKHFDKSVITNSRSVNQMTKRLVMFKDFHTFIESQSDQIESLEDRVRFLEAYNFQGQHFPEMSDRERAEVLRSTGLSYSQISEEIGVSKATIGRWLKDFS